MNPSQKLLDQLLQSFSIAASPIWMDSSTTKYCKELEELIGGADRLAQRTGSIAYERYFNEIHFLCKIEFNH